MTQTTQDARSAPTVDTVWPPQLTRAQLKDYLNAHGFPIGAGSLDKICAPSSNNRPPIARRWGRRDLYERDAILPWAATLHGPTAEANAARVSPTTPVDAIPARPRPQDCDE